MSVYAKPINEAVYDRNHSPAATEQLETEQHLIGTLLVKPANLYRYDIQPEHLEHLGHYLKAIQSVYAATGDTHPLAVADAIVADNPGTDPTAYRANLVEYLTVCLTSDAGGLVEWLKNAYHVRQITNRCRDVLAKGMVYGVKHEELYADLNAINQTVELNRKYQPQKQVVQDWIDQQKKISFTPTGFWQLDRAMGDGLYDGDVLGLAGYAKAGKTLLAGTISGNWSEKGVKHLYVAMEMGAGAIESRNLSRRLMMRNGHLKRDIKGGQNPITADMLNDTTFYLNAPGITWTELKQQMTIAMHRDGIKRFIIDYWQLLANDTRKDDHQYWADCAQGISDFCKKNGAACILVAQLNDDGKTLGSRGLVRACDMLLKIEMCDNPDQRWIKMDATRYTTQRDLGAKLEPYLEINPLGPYMKELQLCQN